MIRRFLSRVVSPITKTLDCPSCAQTISMSLVMGYENVRVMPLTLAHTCGLAS